MAVPSANRARPARGVMSAAVSMAVAALLVAGAGGCAASVETGTAPPGSVTSTASAAPTSSSSSPASSPSSVATSPTSPTTAAGGSAAGAATEKEVVAGRSFCEIVEGLAGVLIVRGNGGPAQTEADWQRFVGAVTQMAEVAPAGIAAQAKAAVQMIKDRQALAKAHNYLSFDAIPAAARTKFISEHRQLQTEVNALVTYAVANCPNVAARIPGGP